MNCPNCGSKNHRTPVTNSERSDQVIRKRVCSDCKTRWFTVELEVPTYAIGWGGASGKPVLRAPLTLKAEHVEALDQREILAACNRIRWGADNLDWTDGKDL